MAGSVSKRLDAKLAEQIVDADQLGYWSYAIVEPFFFPRVIPHWQSRPEPARTRGATVG